MGLGSTKILLEHGLINDIITIRPKRKFLNIYLYLDVVTCDMST